MEKKVKSKQMTLFLQELNKSNEFEFVYYSNHLLLHAAIDTWPTCDVLLCFFSAGFPIKKAHRYYKLNQHVIKLSLQDIAIQKKVLLSREKMVQHMCKYQIPNTAEMGFVVKRQKKRLLPHCSLQTTTSHTLQFKSATHCCQLAFPLVEKPLDANDHQVIVYDAQGGCRKLFRKTDNSCSEYVPNNGMMVRSNGSFLYEPYYATVQAQDVKVYMVGADWYFAEQRQSPATTSTVKRRHDGREERTVVTLHAHEVTMCKQMYVAFGQMICGFDLLRVSQTESRICDVNGFSFVKSHPEFYATAATIVRTFIKQKLV